MELGKRLEDSREKRIAEGALHGTLNPAWLNAKDRMKARKP